MMMEGDWVGVVGWGQQVATGNKRHLRQAPMPLNNKGNPLSLKSRSTSSKWEKPKLTFESVTETPGGIQVFGKC